jgi:hypothetical protein
MGARRTDLGLFARPRNRLGISLGSVRGHATRLSGMKCERARRTRSRRRGGL